MATATYNGFVVWVNRCVITPQAAPGVDCARVKLALRLLGRRAETLFNEVVGVVDIPQRPAPPVAPPRIAPVSSAEGADPHWRGAGPVLSRIRAHLQEDSEFEKSFPGGFREILVDILIQGVREERFPPAEDQPLGTVAFPHPIQDVMNGIRERVAGVSWGDKSAIHMLRQAVAYAWRVYVDRVLGCIDAYIRWHIAAFGPLSASAHPGRVVKTLLGNVAEEGTHLGVPLMADSSGRVSFPWALLLPRLDARPAADPESALQVFWAQVEPFPPDRKPRFEITRVEPSGLGSTETRQMREFLPQYQALAVSVRDDVLGHGAQAIAAGEAGAHLYQRVAVLAQPTASGGGLAYTDGVRTWTARPVAPEVSARLPPAPGAKRSRFAPPEPEQDLHTQWIPSQEQHPPAKSLAALLKSLREAGWAPSGSVGPQAWDELEGGEPRARLRVYHQDGRTGEIRPVWIDDDLSFRFDANIGRPDQNASDVESESVSGAQGHFASQGPYTVIEAGLTRGGDRVLASDIGTLVEAKQIVNANAAHRGWPQVRKWSWQGGVYYDKTNDTYEVHPARGKATTKTAPDEKPTQSAVDRAKPGFWDDADVISRYSRADMLADGSLVDVDTVDGEHPFLEAGVRFPVAMTRASYQKMIAMPVREPVYGNDTPLQKIVDEGTPRIEAGLQRLLPDPAYVQAAWVIYGHALISGWAAQRGLKSTHIGQMWRDSRAPRFPAVFLSEQIQRVTTEDGARRLLSEAIPGEEFTLTAEKTYNTWDVELRVGGQRFGATMMPTRKAALQDLLANFNLIRWIWTQRLALHVQTADDPIGKLKEIVKAAPSSKPTPAERAGNDTRGRAWDVATMLARAVKGAPHTNRVTFTVYAVTDRITPGPVQLQAVIGPGDDGEPVITVGLADEDLS